MRLLCRNSLFLIHSSSQIKLSTSKTKPIYSMLMCAAAPFSTQAAITAFQIAKYIHSESSTLNGWKKNAQKTKVNKERSQKIAPRSSSRKGYICIMPLERFAG